MNKAIENNNVELTGMIISEPEYSHSAYGEDFYNLKISIKRTSGVIDIIPLLISERLFDVNGKCSGIVVNVKGNYRSYNKHTENASKLILFVFVTDIEENDGVTEDENKILLDGFICKEPIYRKTPLGREIADLLIAVNRSYGKTDYIPCIVWGRNARYASRIEIGTRIKLEGRVQSRVYRKMISDTEFEERTAYEVSTNRIEVLENGEE